MGPQSLGRRFFDVRWTISRRSDELLMSGHLSVSQRKIFPGRGGAFFLEGLTASRSGYGVNSHYPNTRTTRQYFYVFILDPLPPAHIHTINKITGIFTFTFYILKFKEPIWIWIKTPRLVPKRILPQCVLMTKKCVFIIVRCFLAVEDIRTH